MQSSHGGAVLAALAIASLAATGAAAQSLVQNGEFDTNLAGWSNLSPGKSWSPASDGTDPGSGSIRIANTSDALTGQFVEQCVPVAGGQDYVAGYSHYSFGVTTTGRADFELYWYDDSLCEGSSEINFESFNSAAVDSWTAVAADVTAPAEAIAVLVHLSSVKLTGSVGDPWTVHFDHVRLVPEPGSVPGSLTSLAGIALAGLLRRLRSPIRS